MPYCSAMYDDCIKKRYVLPLHKEKVIQQKASEILEIEEPIFREIKEIENEIKKHGNSNIYEIPDTDKTEQLQEELLPVIPGEEQQISADELLESQQEEEITIEEIDAAANVILHNSIMFEQEELQELTRTILDYKMQKEDDGSNAQITEETTKLIEEVAVEEKKYLNLYLGSIMYFSDEHWSLWLNGVKRSPSITDDETIQPVRVDTINDHYVRFVWDDIDINAIAPQWRETLSGFRSPWFFSNDNKIYYHATHKKLFFTLSSNQFIDMGTLTIYEGKPSEESQEILQPVSLSNTPVLPGTRQ